MPRDQTVIEGCLVSQEHLSVSASQRADVPSHGLPKKKRKIRTLSCIFMRVCTCTRVRRSARQRGEYIHIDNIVGRSENETRTRRRSGNAPSREQRYIACMQDAVPIDISSQTESGQCQLFAAKVLVVHERTTEHKPVELRTLILTRS